MMFHTLHNDLNDIAQNGQPLLCLLVEDGIEIKSDNYYNYQHIESVLT